MMEKGQERRLNQLHPILRRIYPRFKRKADVIAVCGITDAWRASHEQEALWRRGRNASGEIVRPGVVVTYAHFNESFHSCMPDGLALAWDLAVWDSDANSFQWPSPMSSAGEYIWHAWALLAKPLGLEAGYFWKKKDRPHYQLDLGIEPLELWKSCKDKTLFEMEGIVTELFRTLHEELYMELFSSTESAI